MWAFLFLSPQTGVFPIDLGFPTNRCREVPIKHPVSLMSIHTVNQLLIVVERV